MSITVYYTCPGCGFEIPTLVSIADDDDLPELCPECGALLPSNAHEKVQTLAIEKASDVNADDY